MFLRCGESVHFSSTQNFVEGKCSAAAYLHRILSLGLSACFVLCRLAPHVNLLSVFAEGEYRICTLCSRVQFHEHLAFFCTPTVRHYINNHMCMQFVAMPCHSSASAWLYALWRAYSLIPSPLRLAPTWAFFCLRAPSNSIMLLLLNISTCLAGRLARREPCYVVL